MLCGKIKGFRYSYNNNGNKINTCSQTLVKIEDLKVALIIFSL